MLMIFLLFITLSGLTFAVYVPIVLPLLFLMNRLAFLVDNFVFKIAIYLLMLFVISLFVFHPVIDFLHTYKLI